MNNLFSRTERVTLFEKNDMRIQAYIHYEHLWIEVDTYYTLVGFLGDEDYYQHYIVVDKKYLGKLLHCLKKKVKANTLLDCIKEMFSADSADIDLIDFCKKNKIPFDYHDRIEGFTSSEEKDKMIRKIRSLKAQLQDERKYNYKIH